MLFLLTLIPISSHTWLLWFIIVPFFTRFHFKFTTNLVTRGLYLRYMYTLRPSSCLQTALTNRVKHGYNKGGLLIKTLKMCASDMLFVAITFWIYFLQLSTLLGRERNHILSIKISTTSESLAVNLYIPITRTEYRYVCNVWDLTMYMPVYFESGITPPNDWLSYVIYVIHIEMESPAQFLRWAHQHFQILSKVILINIVVRSLYMLNIYYMRLFSLGFYKLSNITVM